MQVTNREYYARNRKAIIERTSKRERKPYVHGDHFKSRYGITRDDYDVMLQNQEGGCAICMAADELLCVDHDHETGQVRGLLCQKCNRALGQFDDDPTKLLAAMAYLNQNSVSCTRMSNP